MTEPDIHSFLKGWTSNLDNNAESSETFSWGVNGRLYSEDGTLSYHSIEGSLKIYQNSNIVKYLGFWGFKDELICFVKAKQENITSENTQEELSQLEIDVQTCNDNSDEEIDFYSYFEFFIDSGHRPSDLNCSQIDDFDNDDIYIDQIISLRYNEYGEMYQVVLWSGDMNFKIESKIICLGIEENANYKRLYFSDNINYFRVANIKDKNLSRRESSEFTLSQSPLMLQPRIEEVTDEGQLPAMAVIYFYHLISENGQVTNYSPASDVAYVVKDSNDDSSFKGGSPGESTSKAVTVKINLIDNSNFAEVECIAVEFEGKNVPTNIKSLGIKKASNVVYFKHTGAEAEYSENITLADLFENKASWKYCSTLETKNNKLLAGGLRNEPISDLYNKLKMDFALHGWNSSGQTHHCDINPNPRHYNKIDNLNNNPVFKVKKKIYQSIVIFRDFKIRLYNNNNQYIETSLNTDQESYIDRTDFIYNWLKTEKANNPNFVNFFPQLDILLVSGQLIFKREVEQIETDISNYYFTYNTTQIIENVNYEKEYYSNSGTSGRIRGYKSAGYNSGNGFLITFKEAKDELLDQAEEPYDGTNNLMNLKSPSLKKTFIKGEIYRLFVQIFRKSNGEKLFTIPLGDIEIPPLNSTRQELNAENEVKTYGKWVNQSVALLNEGNQTGLKTLLAHRVELDVRLRFDCRTVEEIGIVQIMHVERTPENRTILAQGVSAPLMRLRNNNSDSIRPRYWAPQFRDTWMLPYHGGPATELNALISTDLEGINVNTDADGHTSRVLQSRSLFYFDSPDFIYDTTPKELIDSCKVSLVGRLNTDHTPKIVMNSGRFRGTNMEEYPKFSRKIYAQQLLHNNDSEEYPLDLLRIVGYGFFDYWVNVSVFSEALYFKDENDQSEIPETQFNILGYEKMERGKITSGQGLELDHSLSNNAYCLPSMNIWYGDGIRGLGHKSNEYQYAREMLGMGNLSIGYSTIFMRAERNKNNLEVFNQAFLGVTKSEPDPLIKNSGPSTKIYDCLALINLKRSNEESIFGGKTEIAFSKNLSIPLSETIPIKTVSHRFLVQGDAYLTLFNRVKNDFGENDEDLEYGRQINNSQHDENAEKNDLPYSVKRHWGAWCYSAVLETMIEPRLSHEYEWYRESDKIDFKERKTETLNEAYLNTNNFKRELSRPYRFKDDPNLNNIVAASKVKLSGDFYDSWTEFLVNEFHELDKGAGSLSNLVKQEDEVFAIQERQTSVLNIDRDTMIPTSDGKGVNVKQGAGKSIDGHKIISEYGTNIRRAVVRNKEYGFCFWDESKDEFVKIKDGLLVKSFLHLKIKEMLKGYEVIDSECYFDFDLKETNIRLIAEKKKINPAARKEKFYDSALAKKDDSLKSFVISYNEIQKCFNGIFEYDNDIFMSFKDKIIAPTNGELHRLNEGKILQIFNKDKSMTLGFISNKYPETVKQFVHLSGTISDTVKAKRIYIKTSTGQERTILGTHPRYQIKEGNHSLPLKNMYDHSLTAEEKRLEKATLRGTWAYIEMEFEAEDYKKIDIFVLIAHLRKSFI